MVVGASHPAAERTALSSPPPPRHQRHDPQQLAGRYFIDGVATLVAQAGCEIHLHDWQTPPGIELAVINRSDITPLLNCITATSNRTLRWTSDQVEAALRALNTAPAVDAAALEAAGLPPAQTSAEPTDPFEQNSSGDDGPPPHTPAPVTASNPKRPAWTPGWVIITALIVVALLLVLGFAAWGLIASITDVLSQAPQPTNL